MTTSAQLARSRRRLRMVQLALLAGFTVIGLAMLVLPVGRTELRSSLLHVPYVLALAGGAIVAAWGTWVRFRMDGSSRAWLLSAAFGVLALVFLPHALYDSGSTDPVHFFYGPASRLAFGVVLIIAMSPLPVPRVLRNPRATALVVMLAVIAVVDLVLHADWVQAILEPDPVRSNRWIELAALAAMSVAILQFFVKWIRTRRRILITWIVGVAATAVGSAFMIPAAGWEIRWWWAHLGLLVTAAVFVLGTDRQMFGALDRHELRLVYQPKVNLRTDELIGVEALLRWQHPDQGLVPAGDFIPKAEETDLITRFTFWAISEATAQHRRWLDEGLTIPIAVNVTARLLRDARLMELIKAELAQHHLDPSAIALELTESKALESEQSGAEVLAALAAMGLRIAVDDFGTGYSSLSYLRNLPINEVKMDRSFVAPMASSQHDYTIVSSTLQMAQALGHKVVAEGIEDEDVAELLVGLGCDIGQGYLWSRPLPAEELSAWVRGRTPKPRQGRKPAAQVSEIGPNDEANPGALRSSDEEAGPPQRAVEDGERTDTEPAAVEDRNGYGGQEPAPLLRDLPASGEGRSA